MKILILYFSGTGNTWWIASQLEKNLLERNTFVESCSIEAYSTKELHEKIEDADHVIMGFPAYASKAPYPFMDFIQDLEAVTFGKDLSVFASQALASGDTAVHVATEIIQKGFNLKNTFHFNMSNSFHIPQFKFFKPKDAKRAEIKNKRCLPKINMLANNIMDNRLFIRGNTPIAKLLGDIQRKHADRLIKNASSTLYSDKKTCINCDKCVKICPTKNITFVEESYLFADQCTLCMRCYSFCPTKSINFSEKSLDESKFPRYEGPEVGFKVERLYIK